MIIQNLKKSFTYDKNLVNENLRFFSSNLVMPFLIVLLESTSFPLTSEYIKHLEG